MKMLIWKELRENSGWAALGGLVLLLAEVAALSAGGSLNSETFLLASAFGCSALGAALGALQVVPELRRDQWAGLLHRPVPRSAIFLGKASAGLTLYFLATGLPLLVSVLYAAWPGCFPAPFVPELARPAASDLLLGAAAYFAGLLLGLHRGRWLGARGAIVLGGLTVMLAHLSGSAAEWFPLLAAAVFAAAAAGAMRSDLAARGWISRAALGLVLLLGVQTGVMLVCAILSWLWPDPAQDASFDSFVVGKDGTVYLERSEANGREKLLDPHGREITDGPDLKKGGQVWAPMPLADVEEHGQSRPGQERRSPTAYVQRLGVDPDVPEFWYQLAAPYRYLVGYNRLSGQRIGICDREGFKGSDGKPAAFPGELRHGYGEHFAHLFALGSRLLALDFGERQMTVIFDAQGPAIQRLGVFPAFGARRWIAVKLPSGIRILDGDGSPLLALPYGHDPKRWPEVAIGATPDFAHTFVEYLPPFRAPGGEGVPSQTFLDEIDAEGRVVRSFTKTDPGHARPLGWASHLTRLARWPLASVPATLRRRDGRIPAEEGGLVSATNDLSNGELAALGAGVLALALAALLWARRGGVGRGTTALWVLAASAFGPSGLLAFRLALPWAPRVRCPECGRSRPVRKETCPHCGERWPVVTDNGTGIFETA